MLSLAAESMPVFENDPRVLQCVWNDPLVVFGNDPRLPGARNAVPGSQNGVYSGLCLKMTLEVCLKMTPLPL